MNTELNNDLKNALDKVQDERDRQVNKWGLQSRSMPEWISILGEEFGETCTEANEFHFIACNHKERLERLVKLETEAIQTAAVAVAIAMAARKRIQGRPDAV